MCLASSSLPRCPVLVAARAGQERLLRFDAFESVMWTLRKRLRKDIGWPPDWDEGCREVSRYFKTPPMGSMDWAPWANYEFDAPA